MDDWIDTLLILLLGFVQLLQSLGEHFMASAWDVIASILGVV